VSRGRALAAACGGLVVAACVLWGASALAWTAPGRPGGSAVVEPASAPSALTGVALLALAGVAALVATSGVPRRIVGALLGVVGGVVVVATAAAVLAVSVAVGGGPLLAVGGGLLLAVVGCAVLLREPQLRRLGARYAAAGSPSAHADPDRAAWAALDEGRDPTADPPAAGRPDSGREHSRGRSADPAVAGRRDSDRGPGRSADPAVAGRPDSDRGQWRSADPPAAARPDAVPDHGPGRPADHAGRQVLDQATAPRADASAESDDPGGGRGGGPV